MLKKILTVGLVVLLLNLSCVLPVAARGQQDKEAKQAAKQAAKVKAMLAKLGTGKDARVEIRLRDKTELKGYIRETSDEQFVIVDEQTGQATTVMYAQVEKVKLIPYLKSATKKALTPGRVAKGLALGALGAFGFVALICLVSHGCSD